MTTARRYIGVAAVLLCLLVSGSAAAEKVWTKEATSLRAKPTHKSKRVARVQANRELTVVEKRGRWFRVKSGVKTGWVHRSKLRDGGGEPARSRSRVTRSPDRSPERDPKRGAANGDDDDDANGDARRCRPGAVWCNREGDEMRVVVVSSRVEAFKEPAVDQDIAFLATQGQELVVRGFHEPDWMYVQTLDGKLGWIPKGSVRQKGNFVDARGTVGSGQVPDDTSEARDSRRSSADRGQDRSGDARRGSSGDGDGGDTGADAAMRNSSGSAGGGETQVSKRGDGGEAPSSLLAPEPPSPLSIELGSAVGVALVERTYAATNMGGAGYVASATTAATTVGGDIRYRVQGPWHVGIDGNWSVLAGLTGLAYDPATGESIDLGNFLQQRTELSAKFGFQEERFSAFVRAGGLIEIFYINDLLNDGALPRERLISGTAGVQLEVRPVAPLSLGLRADVLILGALAQTRGREDGDFDTVGLLAPIAQLDGSYAVAKHVVLRAGLRFDRLVPTWTGASVRAPGVNGAERTDQVIRLLLGVGARF